MYIDDDGSRVGGTRASAFPAAHSPRTQISRVLNTTREHIPNVRGGLWRLEAMDKQLCAGGSGGHELADIAAAVQGGQAVQLHCNVLHLLSRLDRPHVTHPHSKEHVLCRATARAAVRARVSHKGRDGRIASDSPRQVR